MSLINCWFSFNFENIARIKRVGYADLGRSFDPYKRGFIRQEAKELCIPKSRPSGWFFSLGNTFVKLYMFWILFLASFCYHQTNELCFPANGFCLGVLMMEMLWFLELQSYVFQLDLTMSLQKPHCCCQMVNHNYFRSYLVIKRRRNSSAKLMKYVNYLGIIVEA